MWLFIPGALTTKGKLWENLGWDNIAILQRAGVRAGVRFCDLGAAMGMFDTACAMLTGASVTGIEYEKDFVHIANLGRDWFCGKQLIDAGKLRFIQGDFLDHDISGYDVLYYFQLGSKDPKAVEDLVLTKMKRGGRFIVYHYDIEGGHPFDRLKDAFSWKRIHVTKKSDTEYPEINAGVVFTNDK